MTVLHACRSDVSRVLSTLLLCAALVTGPASTAAAAMPRARIVYTAETHGQLHPCATCDGGVGGMARRAALLARLVADAPAPLIIAGPGELAQPPHPGAAHSIAPLAITVFSRLPYAAIYLSRADAEANEAAKGPALPTAVRVADLPVVRQYRAGDIRVACVFFPPAATGKGPSPEQLDAVCQAGKKAATEAELVIGISPWGMLAENAAIPFLAGYIHVLLGGGQGLALPGQTTGSPASPGPLWARSATLGRAVVVLDIITPPQGSTEPWLDGVHFTARLAILDQASPEDPSMAALIPPPPAAP